MIKIKFVVKVNAAGLEGYTMEGILYLNKGDSLCNAELRAKAILSILEGDTRIHYIEQVEI